MILGRWYLLFLFHPSLNAVPSHETNQLVTIMPTQARYLPLLICCILLHPRCVVNKPEIRPPLLYDPEATA